MTGGASSGARRGARRSRWAEPPLLRATEYVALIWIAALDGRRRLPGGASRCWPRSPSATTTSSTGCAIAASTPRAVGERAVRRLGRAAGASPSCCWSPARCPAGYYVLAAVLGVGRSSARPSYGWVAVGRVQRPLEYEDEEDEGAVIGMVLAAGAGTRLGPETAELPKTLLRRRRRPHDPRRRARQLPPRRPRARRGRHRLRARAARRARAGARAPPRPEARAGLQPEGARVEQRLLAVVRARARSPRACCSPTATPSTPPRSRRRCSRARGPELVIAVDDSQAAGRGGDEGPRHRRRATWTASTRRSSRRRRTASTSA